MKFFQKEMNIFKDHLDIYLNDETTQAEEKAKCDLFITSLAIANKRFSNAIIFSIIVILVVMLSYEFKALMAVAIMLFAIPYFIARVESDRNLLTEYPFRKIEEIIIFRNLYATIVLVVSIGTVFVSSLLTW